MIILFEENETSFQNLGLGLLKDAKSCLVKETLNDSFELEMLYPITGVNFSEIKLNRIILCPPNPYSEPQPFRIDSISKPINGIIIVKAVHISYDMNGIVVGPINGSTPKLALDQIQNKTILPHNFKFYTDLVATKSFKTSSYYNMRSLLMGSNESILETYEGEILFDKFNVYILNKRGSNKGASVRYAKNMKDISHEVNYERLYNGVYPYYHQETTEASTQTTTDGFKQVYIVGKKPFEDGWLSYDVDGEPYHPVDESPVQIMTDGDYYNKVYSWNTQTQRYTERIYNEMVNLVECVTGMIGMSDKPSWIYIDATKLPNISVKATQDGYFKLASDTDWTKHKKDDIVFEGSIVNASEGLLMYYSEVIPEQSSSVETESTNVTHVELKNKIMMLDTDAAKNMKYNRILPLDLTSEFDETPDEDKLEAKAKEYIEKNKIGQYKYDTKVSFVDISSTTEGTVYDKMENVELGDIVRVVYEALDIDIELRVVSTSYNVLLNRYESIDLGEKSEKISASSVQSGDNVSSLTNDVGYTDVTTVNKIIAKTVTADFIQAKNAKLTSAQIEELQTARIKCTGIIEATQFELDTLIAKMLIADNAVIKQTLEAGTVKVKGDITVTKGSISIENAESGTVFNVDRDGNVIANSVNITGGELNINNTFSVTREGILTAQGADIRGRIEAESGLIAGFNIESNVTEGNTYNRIWSGEINTNNYVLVSPGYNYKITNLDSNIHDWAFAAGSNFGVTKEGNLYAKNVIISGKIEAALGSIAGFNITASNIHTKNKSIGSDKSVYISSSGEYYVISNLDSSYHYWALTIDNLFGVTRDGEIFAKNVNLTGKITATSGKIAGFDISNDSFKLISTNIEISPTQLSYGPNSNFTVSPNGTVKIQNGSDPSVQGYESIVLDSNGITATAITVNNATITLGTIGGFTIGQVDASHPGAIYKNIPTFDSEGSIDGVYLGPDGIRLGKNLKIYNTGRISSGIKKYNPNISYSIGNYCKYEDSLYICIEETTGSFDRSKWDLIDYRMFGIDDDGKLTAADVDISGNIDAKEGHIGSKGSGFTITSNAIYNNFYTDNFEKIESKQSGVYIGTDAIRLGKNPTDNFSFTVSDLNDGGEVISSALANAHKDYLGLEFVFKYNKVNYDRWIKLREQKTAGALDDDSDDYVHSKDPDFIPIKGIPYNRQESSDQNKFILVKNGYTYINCNDPRLWDEHNVFLGVILNLFYGKISNSTYIKRWYLTETQWNNLINQGIEPSLIDSDGIQSGLLSTESLFKIDVSQTGSPWLAIKIESGDDQINDCQIEEESLPLIKLPANTSQMYITFVKYKNFKMSFWTHNSEVIVSDPMVSNISFELVSLPGFIVRSDGTLSAYNAQIYGTFVGDIKITGGSISIASSNYVLKNYILNTSIPSGYRSLTASQLRNMCIILDIEYTVAPRARTDINAKIPDKGTNYNGVTIDPYILNEIYNIAHLKYKSSVFNVDEDGNLRATTGEIADFNLGEDANGSYLSFGTIGQSDSVLLSPGYNIRVSNLDDAVSTRDSHDWIILGGDSFGVDRMGNLYAKSANISGHIEANSGNIGELNIDDQDGSLYYGVIVSGRYTNVFSINNAANLFTDYRPSIATQIYSLEVTSRLLLSKTSVSLPWPYEYHTFVSHTKGLITEEYYNGNIKYINQIKPEDLYKIPYIDDNFSGDSLYNKASSNINDAPSLRIGYTRLRFGPSTDPYERTITTGYKYIAVANATIFAANNTFHEEAYAVEYDNTGVSIPKGRIKVYILGGTSTDLYLDVIWIGC